MGCVAALVGRGDVLILPTSITTSIISSITTISITTGVCKRRLLKRLLDHPRKRATSVKMPRLRLQRSEGVFTKSREVEPKRRSFRRRRGCTVAEVARLVPSSLCLSVCQYECTCMSKCIHLRETTSCLYAVIQSQTSAACSHWKTCSVPSRLPSHPCPYLLMVAQVKLAN